MDRQFLVGCLLVVLVASSGAVAATTGAASAGLAQPEGFDQTTFEITVTENGSARWAIKHHQRLSNESERQAFEGFARNFEENKTQLYRNFVSGAEALVATGSNATNRSMEAKAFDRTAYTNVTANFEDRGTIELQFTWTHFGRIEGDRVIVGDVFGENFYIGQDQALVFVRGQGLQLEEALPEPTSWTNPDSLTESQSVTWEGERTFNPERPYAVFAPRQPATTTSTTDAEGGPSGTEDSSGTDTSGGTATDSQQGSTAGPATSATTEPLGSGTSNPMVWLVGVVIVVLGVSSAIAYRTGSVSLPGRDAETMNEATEQPPTAETGTTTQNQTSISDEELLSDDDRVVKLLEDNGGRMKQVNIVEETDWSKSKVSRVLSAMAEEDRIVKVDVGRGNVVMRPEDLPPGAESAFDD